MMVFTITNLRGKRKMLLKILLAALLLLILLPLLYQNYLTASTDGEPLAAASEEAAYPGEPIRVSSEFDRFWQGLARESGLL